MGIFSYRMPSVVVGEEITKPDNGEDKPEHEEHERACQQQYDGLDETFHGQSSLKHRSICFSRSSSS